MADIAAGGTVAAAPGSPAFPESRNPFRTRAYVIWWLATIFGGMGVGIQVVTVPLFVRDRVAEDDRALAISFALISVSVPLAVLLLVGGVVADRVERRKIMTRVYSFAAVASVAYVVLSGFDVRVIWPVFLLGALIGSCDAFGQPARMSMVPQLVPQAQLQNGFILGTVAFMAAFQFLGPAAGGILADYASLTVAFSAEVVFLMLGAFLAWQIPMDKPVPTGKTIRADLADGIGYVRRSPALLGLLFMQILPGLFLIGPFRTTAVLLVEDVLKESDKWVGFLSGGFGVGVLSGSVLMTLLKFKHRGLILCLSPITGGIIFILYGVSEVALVSFIILIGWGWSAALFINLVTPLIQEAASREMLGRVMSMSNLCFAISTPLGLLYAGIISSIWGPQEAVIVSGIAFGLIGIWAGLFLRPVRRLE